MKKKLLNNDMNYIKNNDYDDCSLNNQLLEIGNYED